MKDKLENKLESKLKNNPENTNDLRVKKTLKAIDLAFQELIYEEDNYEKITLKKLTEKAQIHKKTFYRYYSSLDDLLSKFQEEISSDYIRKVSNFKIPEEMDKIQKEFFIFSESYGKFYDKITINPKFDYIRQKMIDNVTASTWLKSAVINNMNPYKKNLFLEFAQATALSIYKQWVDDGRKIPLEEMANITAKILVNGIELFR